MTQHQDVLDYKLTELLTELNTKLEAGDLAFTGTDLDVNISASDEVLNNGLQYAGRILIEGVYSAASGYIIGETDIPADEIWEINQARFYHGSASRVYYIRHGDTTTSLTFFIVNNANIHRLTGETIDMVRGDIIYCSYISGGGNLNYNLSGKKWTII